MNSTALTQSTFPVAMTNTIREAFVNCPSKAYWAYCRRLVPQYPSIHLHAGSAFAKGLEETRRQYYEHHATPSDAFDAGFQALTAAYGNFDIDNGLTDSNKSLENLQRAFTDVFFEYPLDKDNYIPHITSEGRAALEFSFALPMNLKHPDTSEVLMYAGKFDMLAQSRNDPSSLWVLDDKTTGQLGPAWAQQWNLNSQFTGYIYAAQQYGYNVRGAIIRGVGLLKTRISHAQVPLSRSQFELDRWWEQLHRDTRMFIAQYEADRDADKGGSGKEFSLALGSACSAYGGCPYARLTQSRNPEEWIESYYRISDYDPLKSSVEA